MWRTARITFAADGVAVTTVTERVFFDPAYSQFWQDDAVCGALLALGVDDFRIIEWSWVD